MCWSGIVHITRFAKDWLTPMLIGALLLCGSPAVSQSSGVADGFDYAELSPEPNIYLTRLSPEYAQTRIEALETRIDELYDRLDILDARPPSAERDDEILYCEYLVEQAYIELDRLYDFIDLTEHGVPVPMAEYGEGSPPPPPPPAPAPPPPPPPPSPAAPLEPVVVPGEEPVTSSGPELLDFPWPPPAPSDRMSIDRSLVVSAAEESISMLEVSRRFTRALTDIGYTDHRFYATPGQGFALITRMERIRPDGTPEPDEMRFLDPDARAPFSLGRFMAELFFAPEGHYRVIVFIVTAENFTPGGETMTEDQADTLLSEGLIRLPARYASIPFSEAHFVDALIYEFYKGPRDMDVNTVAPVRLPARQHLDKISFEAAIRALQSGAD